MIAVDVDPILSAADIEDLLEVAKRADPDGLGPSDENWTPTYDLDAAAAEGWRTKAGRVVPRFGVSIDGDALHRQQIYAHCLSQAEAYARRVTGSIGVRPIREPITTDGFQVEA
jgi:hypothetical protein